MKKNKGITLIALIITIVIMLILVAVTVNVLIKSNVIGSAEKTAQRYKEEQDREGNLNNINVNGKELDEYLKLIGKEQEDDEKDDSKFPAIQAGKVATQISSFKGAIVPTGYAVSTISTEQDLNGGIVMYSIPTSVDTTVENFWTDTDEDGVLKVQSSYDQFVWVPVKTPYVTTEELNTIITKSGTSMTETEALQTLADNNIYPMAVQYKTQEEIHYRGVLYTPELNGESIKFTVNEISTTDDYTTAEYLREPAFLSDEGNGDVGNAIGITQNSLQETYDSMINSIKETGGFWVARFELNGEANDYSKRNKEPISGSWYELYSKCSNYSTSKATGTMITGSQWDQIMIWMKDVKNGSNFYVLDSTSMGNYATETGSPVKSGSNNKYSVKNVFDMAGNYIETTTTAASNLFRMKRGSYCGEEDEVSVSKMQTYDTTYADGTRMTLIVNN